jgi:2-polyprenyl-6-methoxyphenol hydroxylase-like FAD-dependent oxidoreductase
MCPDVAVVGAGPTGCVTALAFAQRGASVVLIEAQNSRSRKLAGEWLHPPGAEVLQRLGVGSIPQAADHRAGLGFVVFPEDGVKPIVLPYPGGAVGQSCEHQALVAALRGAAAAHANISFLPRTRVTGIEEQRLCLAREGSERISSIQAGLIVGADGRSSLVRRCLGLPDDRRLVSYMAGVLLEDAALPFEGFGHVFLGGLGPAFVCRISPRHVRVCLDIPVHAGQLARDSGGLYEAYRPVLPTSLLPAFRKALESDRVVWTANQLRPRIHYGRPGLVLVGDAVGHFHPLTAVGMTLGFLDGYGLASCKSFAEYRRERSNQSCVAELLASALYKMFTLEDDGAVSLRSATYRMWRHTREERRRTMRLLSGAETDLVHFNRAFLKVMVLGAQEVLQDAVFSGRWRHTARVLKSFAGWLGWLAAGTLPRLLRTETVP